MKTAEDRVEYETSGCRELVLQHFPNQWGAGYKPEFKPEALKVSCSVQHTPAYFVPHMLLPEGA